MKNGESARGVKEHIKDIHGHIPSELLLRTVRTGEGLRDALFEQLDGLRNGTINPTVAIAAAKLACQIINTVKVEVEYQRHIRAIRSIEGEAATIDTIRLGAPE